jgi:DNA-binding NarL/FixJ family response regulator
MNIEQFIPWFTGLFEGEGSFYITKGIAKGLSLTSTDLDVLERIQEYLGGNICASTTKKEHWKQAYIWTIHGINAKRVVEDMQPYLLSRRLNRSQEWLTLYNSNVEIQATKKLEQEQKIQQVLLLSETGLTHSQIASQMGYERSSVTKIINKIRP